MKTENASRQLKSLFSHSQRRKIPFFFNFCRSNVVPNLINLEHYSIDQFFVFVFSVQSFDLLNQPIGKTMFWPILEWPPIDYAEFSIRSFHLQPLPQPKILLEVLETSLNIFPAKKSKCNKCLRGKNRAHILVCIYRKKNINISTI